MGYIAMEDGPRKDAFPIENRDIFHCYVSLPEGKQNFVDDWMTAMVLVLCKAETSGYIHPDDSYWAEW